MNAKRGFTLVLILALFALALTACGGKTDNGTGKKGGIPTNTPAPTDTPTPTPTEVPKTPEGRDRIAIDLFFETAEAMSKGEDFPLDAGTRFILRFENDEAVIELESDKTYRIRAWESWVHMTDFPKGRYKMESEQYARDGAYGTLTGTLQDDGSIRWISDNISGELYDYISPRGVEQDPIYLDRVAQSKELVGEWHDDILMPFSVMIDDVVSPNDKETRKYYNNLISLLKQHGFSGSMPVAANCYILNEKELIFSLTIDWSDFLSALDKSTNTSDKMLNFLSVVTGASKSTIKAAIKMEKTDIMTFGGSVVYTLKLMCQENPGLTVRGAYTIDGDIIRFTDGRHPDKMTFDRKNNILVYEDLSLKCKMKKK
ncbi:MAG: hypothetical protein IKI15_02565 [Lachnospiraceae bacterium]|nr:hypothetical protein [Lachnospiraceae bacterium]